MVRCECRPWFAGRNCQINLKLLLIVGCVSVILMIVIACGVSCFCCRDRNAAKDNIPCEYHEKLMEKEIKMELLYHFFGVQLFYGPQGSVDGPHGPLFFLVKYGPLHYFLEAVFKLS